MLGSSRVITFFLIALFFLGFKPWAHACDKREPTQQMGRGPHDFSAGVRNSTLWQEGDEGEPLFIRARVLDTCGKPLAGARIRIVHANWYGNHEADRWRADLTSDDRGSFNLVTVFPGYTGGLPRHMHFIIDHPDHHQLVTRLFFKNDPSIDQSIEDLAMVLEEVEREQGKGWLAGFEFVLAPK